MLLAHNRICCQMKRILVVRLAAILAAVLLSVAGCYAQEAIDLGLSVKWASCNLGATEPEQAGNYYAWGETKPKPVYSWKYYKWSKDEGKTFTKYNNKPETGKVDNRQVLSPTDDPACMLSEGYWRMPTREELLELMEKCSWRCINLNGALVFEGRSLINGNIIYLPLAGVWNGAKLEAFNDGGLYWTSSLDTGESSYDNGPSSAWIMYLADEIADLPMERYYGLTIRPVTEE